MKTKEAVKAWWWRDCKNLGDVLTPYIIEKLSGKKCQHVGYKWLYVISYILRQIRSRKAINKDLITPFFFIEPQYILGIGSILNHKSDGHAIAWGSGFLKEKQFFTGKKAVAVRGKYSAERLLELGFPRVDVLGDPALLLPLIYKANPIKNEKLAIIPHITEYKKFKEKYGEKFDVIKFNTDDIEGTINKLCSYRYILSSSLHGIIIGQAYSIPVIWIEDTVLEEDSFHFKFRDYFSSVGIEYYDPYKNIDEILYGNIDDFFYLNKSKSIIQFDLSSIQQDLLKVAPFQVLPQFKL